MRRLATLGVLSVLVLGFAPNAVAGSKKPLRLERSGHVRTAQTAFQRATSMLAKAAAFRGIATRPSGTATPKAGLSALEVDIVGRINAQRGARGLRPLRVSRGLTAAANYHSHQMGLFGFFEHESRNGAPFWRRIERFYPSGRGYWSVGENIFWESPDTSGSSAVREWMQSSPHRRNILTGEWREVGVAAVHFPTARGAFGGRSVTIVTADFGVRR
ncbi:MAG: CAP domain-containing protein [Actinomycetota bacterium]